MVIISLLQDITQTTVDQDLLDFLSTPGGILAAVGFVLLAGAAVIWAQSRYANAQAKERSVSADAQGDVYQQAKEQYDSLRKEFEEYKAERNRVRNEDQQKITTLIESHAMMKEKIDSLQEQVSEAVGAKDALFKTNEMLVQDNYKIATDLGEVTQSKKTLLVEIDALKTEIARLTKERDDCHTDSAKERDSFNVRIQVMTTRIATLESELAEKTAEPSDHATPTPDVASESSAPPNVANEIESEK